MTPGILIFSAIVLYLCAKYKTIRIIALLLISVAFLGCGVLAFYAWTDYEFWPPFVLWLPAFIFLYIPVVIYMIDDIFELNLRDAPE